MCGWFYFGTWQSPLRPGPQYPGPVLNHSVIYIRRACKGTAKLGDKI